MNIHKETALICTIMQISMQLSLVSPESLDSISALDREKGMMGVFWSFLLHQSLAVLSLCHTSVLSLPKTQRFCFWLYAFCFSLFVCGRFTECNSNVAQMTFLTSWIALGGKLLIFCNSLTIMNPNGNIAQHFIHVFSINSLTLQWAMKRNIFDQQCLCVGPFCYPD